FSRDGKHLAVGFLQDIKLFNLLTRQPGCTIPHGVYGGGDRNLALSPDGTLLATISSIGPGFNPQSLAVVHLWDTANGKHLFDLRGHFTTVGGVSFSPDGERLASAGWDGTVKLWDIQTRQEVLTLRGPRGYAFGVAFSTDGGRLVSAHSLYNGPDVTGSGEIRIWDARPLPPS